MITTTEISHRRRKSFNNKEELIVLRKEIKEVLDTISSGYKLELKKTSVRVAQLAKAERDAKM